MKILIADDELISRKLLDSSLTKWGYEVVVAKDGDEAARELNSPDAPQMVVLDWLMPGIDGAALCQAIRHGESERYTYVVMLTGKRSRHDLIRGLEAGADDYLRKPFDPAELKVRLRTGQRILELQQELISAGEKLRGQATQDSLTGLWNRGTILEILKNEIDRARRQASALAIALVDIDSFKHVNDTYGHLIGDEAIRAVSRSLRESLRANDSVGRYGGEEFLIVFTDCDGISAERRSDRLREEIANTAASSEANLRLTISVGVSEWDHAKDTTVHELLRTADEALYRAKRGGRNRIEFSAAAPQSAVSPPGIPFSDNAPVAFAELPHTYPVDECR